jgi:hypothetical protein
MKGGGLGLFPGSPLSARTKAWGPSWTTGAIIPTILYTCQYIAPVDDYQTYQQDVSQD